MKPIATTGLALIVIPDTQDKLKGLQNPERKNMSYNKLHTDKLTVVSRRFTFKYFFHWPNATILNVDTRYYSRNILEMVYIKSYITAINVQIDTKRIKNYLIALLSI